MSKAESKLAYQNARCPWCQELSDIVQSRDCGEHKTEWTICCGCRGRKEYYAFFTVKKPKQPPYILFKLLNKPVDN